jgi:hypothetical protein
MPPFTLNCSSIGFPLSSSEVFFKHLFLEPKNLN